jgi:hypothetical protein
MRRFLRPTAVAVFVLAIAVTPLTATTSSGHFEYRFPPRDSMDWFGHSVEVDDRTGLIANIGPANLESREHVSNIGNSGNWLLVRWLAGGCEAFTRLVFQRVGAGYQIDVTSGGSRCPYLDLRGYSIVLKLWSPVDAATVEVHSRFDP